MPANLENQQWPQAWNRSVFIPIPKKGNAKECSHTCICLLNCGGYCRERIIRIIPVRRRLQIWVPFFLLSLNLFSQSPTWMTLRVLHSQDPQFELCSHHERDSHACFLTWLTPCLTLLMLPKSWHCFWIEIWSQGFGEKTLSNFISLPGKEGT